MSTLYMLIGVPASGKSTWIEQNHSWTKDCVYISSDKHIEEYAAKEGKTYSEVFNKYVSTARKLMNEEVKQAVADGKDIIWDQTNTLANSRKTKLNMAPGYKKVAVVFSVPEIEELSKRLEARPGKEISESVMKHMIDDFQQPTADEGFDEFWNA